MSIANGALLDVQAVTKSFEGLRAVNECSLQVSKGTITGLIGPNGAGKTTLFNIVTGFLKPTSGRIVFAGGRIDGLPPHKVFDRGIVRTFQIPRELKQMTVLENLMLVPAGQSGERLWNPWLLPFRVRRQEREIRDKALDVLEFVNLWHLRNEYASTLSSGQKKLLELARTLMCDPQLILLDEPGAGVNPTLMKSLALLVERLRDESGITFFLDRARHGPGGAPLQPRHRHEQRREDRGGHAGRGGPRRTGARGVPGRTVPMTVVLEADGVVSGYCEVDILHGVSLMVDEGEIVSVIGPNGAGKSTLLKSVFRAAQAAEGQAPPRRRRRDGSAAPEDGPQGRLLRAAERKRLPLAHDPGEPGDGRVHRRGQLQAAAVGGVRSLPDPGGEAACEGGQALRRPAADAGPGARPHAPAAAPAPRRTDRQPLAAHGRRHLDEDPRHQSRQAWRS